MLGENLVFIKGMQLMNSSSEKLDKNLSEDKFKYLSQEFSKKQLD